MVVRTHCSFILLLSCSNIFLTRRQKTFSGEMARTELRYAPGVGHDNSNPKYAQKNLTWGSHGGARRERKKKR